MQRISLLIGLLLVGNGFSQVYQNPQISNDEDLMASAATLFGPKTFGLHHANLGNFGPLGYGSLGGMRIGSIGPLHYGHIGGIRTDSFLGAQNPNAEEDESPGSIGTPTGDRSYQQVVGNPMQPNWQEVVGNPMDQDRQEIDGNPMQQNWQEVVGNTMGQNWQEIDGNPMQQNWQEVVGNPMQQNWQEIDDQNFVGMEPNEQEMWELGLQPQMPENSRAFLNDGLFGVKDKDKFEIIPPKLPPKFQKPPPKFTPPPPPPPPPPTLPPPPAYNYYGGGYGNHGNIYGSHSHGHGSHSHSSPGTYRRYGGGHRGYGSHGHGFGGHGHGFGGHGFNKYGSHGHSHGGSSSHFESHHSTNYHQGFGHSFRANDDQMQPMPYAYNSNDQLQEFNQAPNPNFR